MSPDHLLLEEFTAQAKDIFGRSDLSGQAHIDLFNLMRKIYYSGRRQGAKECGLFVINTIQKEIF